MRAQDARGVAIVALASIVAMGALSLFSNADDTPTVSSGAEAASTPTTADLQPAPVVAVTDSSSTEPLAEATTPQNAESAVDDTDVVDLVGEEPGSDTSCVLTATSLRTGDTGDDVRCLQNALVAAGVFNGAATAEFDTATHQAVTQVQTDRNLFIDGVVGRETALSLGIWPDEQANVIRTPPPRPGAVDTLGYALSSVATSGPDAPPLPADSGSGRRLVYERAGQRVWAVDDDGSVIRSWLVSGSKYANELPGTHEVYSRSEVSTAWNGQGRLPKMVRWLKTDIGAIGFHGLPSRIADGSMYQTEAELGTRLSGGCQRQADLDAAFTWDFAQVGTKVVVL